MSTVPKPTKKTVTKKNDNPLIVARPKTWGKGNINAPRDLTRYIKWPRYIRIQRQKSILMKRLKVPPALNLFHSHAITQQTAKALLKILETLKPEAKADRRKREREAAKELAEKQTKEGKNEKAKQPKEVSKRQPQLAYGINNVTRLIERKKAKLVVVAHDVDPIEIVVWIPYLCKKLHVPFAIMKGKARLGQLVHRKTAAVVAVTEVKKENQKDFDAIVDQLKSIYFDNNKIYREFGGLTFGYKHVQKQKKIDAKLLKEKEDKEKQKSALGSN